MMMAFSDVSWGGRANKTISEELIIKNNHITEDTPVALNKGCRKL